MKYEIKSYQEEFLDDQVRIGSAIFNKWPFGGQTPKEQLKQQYSQPDFDPETRLYAFHEGKMVGFITTSVFEEEGVKKALFEFPFVEEGHEEAEKVLIDHAIKVLKGKEALILRTRAGEYWGKRKQMAEEYGFTHTSDLLQASKKRLDEIDSSKLLNPVDVKAYDPKIDADKLLQLVMKQYNVPEENAKPVVERYEDWKLGNVKSPFGFPQKLVSHVIIVKDEEIVGRALGIQSEQFGQNTAQLAALYVKDNNENVRGQLLAAVIRDSKEMGCEELIIHTGPWIGEKAESYTPYGFEFLSKVAYYEKEI
ncbi:MAG: GNAT family N-acetyltransferase [Candidatus Hermodarchaeota archaeon]